MKRLYWILGIALAAAAVVGGARIVQRGGQEKRQQAVEEIADLEFALDRYAKATGDYPSTEQGLHALWERPLGLPRPVNWAGPYIDDPVFNDPWGRPYVYLRPGRMDAFAFDLFSRGADGIEGGRGENEDVVNWLRPEDL